MSSDGGPLDFSVDNENRSLNISFLNIYEIVLLIIGLSSELKLPAVRLSPLRDRGLLAASC